MTLIAQIRLIAAAQWENDPGLGWDSTPKTSHQVKESFFDFWTTALGAASPREAREVFTGMPSPCIQSISSKKA